MALNLRVFSSAALSQAQRFPRDRPMVRDWEEDRFRPKLGKPRARGGKAAKRFRGAADLAGKGRLPARDLPPEEGAGRFARVARMKLSR